MLEFPFPYKSEMAWSWFEIIVNSDIQKNFIRAGGYLLEIERNNTRGIFYNPDDAGEKLYN